MPLAPGPATSPRNVMRGQAILGFDCLEQQGERRAKDHQRRYRRDQDGDPIDAAGALTRARAARLDLR